MADRSSCFKTEIYQLLGGDSIASDAHCHLEGNEELATLQQENDVLTIINCDSPLRNGTENQQLAVGRHQYLSFGLHPWKTEDYTFEEIYPYLQQAAIIGEIGA